MVFKKDLTPIGKGGITKHRGKGGTEQRVPRGMPDAVTGPPSIGRVMNRYPKMPPPAPAPSGPAMPMPGLGPLPPEG